LGIATPVTIRGRILLQKIWKEGIGWDDELTTAMNEKWNEWLSELCKLKEIRVPRCYSIRMKTAQEIQLHTFCDASQMAYCCVIYLRIKYQDRIEVSFVSSKAKVAPLKHLSIPRLELQAAVLGARLSSQIVKEIGVKISSTSFWTDSRTVLCWINSTKSLTSFVANRVGEILELTESTNWKWITTKENVADDATRDNNDINFSCNSRWFQGPPFLKTDENTWCSQPSLGAGIDQEEGMDDQFLHGAGIDQEAEMNNQYLHGAGIDREAGMNNQFLHGAGIDREAEINNQYLQGAGIDLESEIASSQVDAGIDLHDKVENVVQIFNLMEEDNIVLPDPNKFSSWLKLIRSTAWMYRFIKKTQKMTRNVGELTIEEIEWAKIRWYIYEQSQNYKAEIHDLTKNLQLKQSSKLIGLNPFLDDENVLRVGGRLKNADLPDDMKHPIILPGNSIFVKLLVQHHHKKAFHQGLDTVINELKGTYYIFKMRSVVKREFYNCQFCRIRKAKPINQQMGNLPQIRLTPNIPPFTYTGIDYFGPLEVTIGRRHEKRWIVLFTCMTIRAIHIEIAATLTTDSAIMAIRRFIARRGCIKNIYSDNGTNFRGADTELKRSIKELNQERMSAQVTSYGINWNFNPASAPHMGGCWERLIKSVKNALRNVLNEKYPKEEVLHTFLVEIEFLVNSRPLLYPSTEPFDCESITPNHILIGRKGELHTPAYFQSANEVVKKQWRQSQQLVGLFWSRWVKEYLPTLLERKKWQLPVKNIRIGDVVMIKDFHEERGHWPLGRIIKCYPGDDGLVRVVDVQTNYGVFKRAVTKLARTNVEVCVDSGNQHRGENEATQVNIICKSASKTNMK
jgi:hypothetical protein